jgi:hypothetical protein
MKKMLTTLLSVSLLVGVMAVPASAAEEANFVDFVAEQADAKPGRFNIIGNVVLALAGSGDLTEADVAALGSAEITAFLPTDVAFRRLAAGIEGVNWWEIRESEVIPILVGALGLPTIAEVVKYHIYAGGKVDYRTALSLDSNRRNGTDATITMYNGGELDIDRRFRFLQLDDAGTAGFGTNNPFVLLPLRNIDGGNALVHGINKVLLP